MKSVLCASDPVPESDTVNTTVAEPAVVGVPEMTPSANESPVGSVPDFCTKVYGIVPPLTVPASVASNESSTYAANVLVVCASGFGPVFSM